MFKQVEAVIKKSVYLIKFVLMFSAFGNNEKQQQQKRKKNDHCN